MNSTSETQQWLGIKESLDAIISTQPPLDAAFWERWEEELAYLNADLLRMGYPLAGDPVPPWILTDGD